MDWKSVLLTNVKGAWTFLKGVFDLSSDKADEGRVVRSVYSGIDFKGANLWVLIFAIFIASLGLNVNSTAVIIGAMLISPLMGPIIGIGMAVGINDMHMLARALRSYLIATVISVLTATLFFLISPISEAQSELLARTSPTLYDVLIAFFGGAAGIVALSTKGENNVLPGVAIATALMPPLCTAGFGLATGDGHFFFGAFYLYFINTVFITLSTWLIVKLLRFHPKAHVSELRARSVRRFMTGLIVLTMIPATIITVKTIRESVSKNNVSRFVKSELSQPGTQVISNSLDSETLTLHVVAVGKEITAEKQAAAQRQMGHYGLEKYSLNIVQGTQSDSLLALNRQLAQLHLNTQKLSEISSKNAALAQQLDDYQRYEQITVEIDEEIKPLFPEVASISLARVAEPNAATGTTRHSVVALVTLQAASQRDQLDTDRLQAWLQKRIKTETVKVVVE